MSVKTWPGYSLEVAFGLVAGAGFEPAKAKPPDLQSGPFVHSGIPPEILVTIVHRSGFETQFRCVNSRSSRDSAIAANAQKNRHSTGLSESLGWDAKN